MESNGTNPAPNKMMLDDQVENIPSPKKKKTVKKVSSQSLLSKDMHRQSDTHTNDRVTPPILKKRLKKKVVMSDKSTTLKKVGGSDLITVDDVDSESHSIENKDGESIKSKTSSALSNKKKRKRDAALSSIPKRDEETSTTVSSSSTHKVAFVSNIDLTPNVPSSHPHTNVNHDYLPDSDSSSDSESDVENSVLKRRRLSLSVELPSSSSSKHCVMNTSTPSNILDSETNSQPQSTIDASQQKPSSSSPSATNQMLMQSLGQEECDIIIKYHSILSEIEIIFASYNNESIVDYIKSLNTTNPIFNGLFNEKKNKDKLPSMSYHHFLENELYDLAMATFPHPQIVDKPFGSATIYGINLLTYNIGSWITAQLPTYTPYLDNLSSSSSFELSSLLSLLDSDPTFVNRCKSGNINTLFEDRSLRTSSSSLDKTKNYSIMAIHEISLFSSFLTILQFYFWTRFAYHPFVLLKLKYYDPNLELFSFIKPEKYFKWKSDYAMVKRCYSFVTSRFSELISLNMELYLEKQTIFWQQFQDIETNPNNPHNNERVIKNLGKASCYTHSLSVENFECVDFVALPKQFLLLNSTVAKHLFDSISGIVETPSNASHSPTISTSSSPSHFKRSCWKFCTDGLAQLMNRPREDLSFFFNAGLLNTKIQRRSLDSIMSKSMPHCYRNNSTSIHNNTTSKAASASIVSPLSTKNFPHTSLNASGTAMNHSGSMVMSDVVDISERPTNMNVVPSSSVEDTCTSSTNVDGFVSKSSSTETSSSPDIHRSNGIVLPTSPSVSTGRKDHGNASVASSYISHKTSYKLTNHSLLVSSPGSLTDSHSVNDDVLKNINRLFKTIIESFDLPKEETSMLLQNEASALTRLIAVFSNPSTTETDRSEAILALKTMEQRLPFYRARVDSTVFVYQKYIFDNFEWDRSIPKITDIPPPSSVFHLHRNPPTNSHLQSLPYRYLCSARLSICHLYAYQRYPYECQSGMHLDSNEENTDDQHAQEDNNNTITTSPHSTLQNNSNHTINSSDNDVDPDALPLTNSESIDCIKSVSWMSTTGTVEVHIRTI